MTKRKIHIDNEPSEDTANTCQPDENKCADTEITESAGKDKSDNTEAAAESLEEKCKEAEARAETEHDNFLRTLAEYNNYRRRTRDEIDQARKYGAEDLIIRMLPLIDNFERGLKSANETKDFDSLQEGVSMILRQMIETLAKDGLQVIETDGKLFDHNFHEAVMREENTDLPEGTIIETFQKGYLLGDKVIRPSMVKVSHKE